MYFHLIPFLKQDNFPQKMTGIAHFNAPNYTPKYLHTNIRLIVQETALGH